MKYFLLTFSLMVMTAYGQKHPSKPAPHQQESPFACNLSVMTPAEQEEHRKTGAQLFGAVQEVKELRDGYALRLPADSPTIADAAQFVEKERLCCPFMKFTIEVGAEHGPLWMHITGRKGAKDFIREEFDLGSLIK